MTQHTIPADVIEQACRTDYDNRYHKIKADLVFDVFLRIWNSAVAFALLEAVPVAANRAALRSLVVDSQRILAAHLPPNGPSKADTIKALLELLDGPRSRAALAEPVPENSTAVRFEQHGDTSIGLNSEGVIASISITNGGPLAASEVALDLSAAKVHEVVVTANSPISFKLEDPEPQKLRVLWIPQIPGKPFHVPVVDIEQAKLLLTALARYDLFQYENRIKPEYANAGGLEVFDPEFRDHDNGGEKVGEWIGWESADGDDIDSIMREEAQAAETAAA